MIESGQKQQKRSGSNVLKKSGKRIIGIVLTAALASGVILPCEATVSAAGGDNLSRYYTTNAA